MAHPVSPLAPATFAELPEIAGVRFATAEAGIKYRNRTDVLLVALDPGTAVAGVFTRSRCPSAPVEWCREKLGGGVARALLVNSGNANAFTGQRGRDAVAASAEYAAVALDVPADEVFLASTGVIGEPLDPEKFARVTGEMAMRLAPGPWIDAARAIMTTDTFPKVAAATVSLDGVEVRISGIAKGSGMIAPDMATMLSFVFTDAAIAAPVLQELLRPAIEQSFNAITVDSDTSTSDTCMVFATGKAPMPDILSAEDPRAARFAKALGAVLHDLALQVVRDGEGATKFVTVNVEGAESDRSAKAIAFAIANSPLVKTAIAGEDANWGRIVMAVGKAGEPADRDLLDIHFGDIRVAHRGERDTGYDEAAVSAYMRREEISVSVGLGLGTGRASVYTCDLTHGYISINGDYRS
jgi:glutamate N-acetyltransferase/amino-acid N-acetyltransferase